MVKVVFLLGETKTMVNKWKGITAKRKRTLGQTKILYGIEVIEALIIDRINASLKEFIFVPIEKEIDAIPKFLKSLKEDFEKSVMIVSMQDPSLVSKLIGESKKRYHYNEKYGWIFLLKGSIKEQMINEFISSFFTEEVNEKLNCALKRDYIKNLKKTKVIINTKYF